MSESANIELACRLLAALESGEESLVDQIVHPAHRDHANTGGPRGPAGVRQSLRHLRASCTDLRVVAEDVIASGDRVVIRTRVTGSGSRLVETEQIHIWRVADGQLAEHWMVPLDPAPAANAPLVSQEALRDQPPSADRGADR